MFLICTGSSSSGNNYILKGEKETLLIDCGIPLLEIKKALNFDLSSIVGCCQGHIHGDHSKYVRQYMDAGIKVYTNPEAAQAIGLHHNLNSIETQKAYNIGSFKIKAFDLVHDCRNYGFLIENKECGLLVYITDTNYCHYKFPGLNQVLLEINYDERIVNEKLMKGTANIYVRNRVIGSHMELQTAKDFLRANDLTKVNNIVLLHLSAGNSDSKLFKKEIQELTGKNVFVAEPGLIVPFNKQPF